MMAHIFSKTFIAQSYHEQTPLEIAYRNEIDSI